MLPITGTTRRMHMVEDLAIESFTLEAPELALFESTGA
jgi:hypothetical protein